MNVKLRLEIGLATTCNSIHKSSQSLAPEASDANVKGRLEQTSHDHSFGLAGWGNPWGSHRAEHGSAPEASLQE